jgi:hypothetical protein
LQVYVQDPAGLPVVNFWARMLAFGSLHLQPGEVGELALTILWRDLALYDRDITLGVFPGSYLVSVGPNSHERPLQAQVQV